MTVPFLDLWADYAPLADDVERAVREVLASQSFILGPQVARFERAVAELLGIEHAVGVSSGTDALLVSLMAEGIGPGDEVITTPFSFFATAGAILRAGARPVFVDIEPESFNIDAARVAEAISPRTKALVPVHLFGRAAAMDELCRLSAERGLCVIEDAAQALGTGFREETSEQGPERPAGTWGHYGCFSFFPSKNLGGAGDGGLVVCRDGERARRLVQLRAQGARVPHCHEILGGNFRLDTLQAAVLETKLPALRGWVRRRRQNAERYRGLFADAGLVAAGTTPTDDAPIVLPPHAPGHSYNQFVVRAKGRDGLAAHLRERQIGCAIYYPRPLHLQPALATLGYREGAFPVAERAAAEVLALPIYPALDDAQAERVVRAIAAYYGR